MPLDFGGEEGVEQPVRILLAGDPDARNPSHLRALAGVSSWA